MGVELVQGNDLFVDESITYMKTTRGPEKVDIIYRRIDDKFIDPLLSIVRHLLESQDYLIHISLVM